MKLNNLSLSIVLVIILSSYLSVNAQITIGSSIKPVNGALLELKEFEAKPNNVTATKGLLMPRVKLKDKGSLEPTVSDSHPDIISSKKEHQGLTVFHIGSDSMDPGIYVWDGEQWVNTLEKGSSEAKWFYMPGFPIDVSQDIELAVNLYDEYKKQFTRVPFFQVIDKEKIKFVVLGYDTNSFSSVNIEGAVLKYKANPASIGAKSFLNIICQLL